MKACPQCRQGDKLRGFQDDSIACERCARPWWPEDLVDVPALPATKPRQLSPQQLAYFIGYYARELPDCDGRLLLGHIVFLEAKIAELERRN